MSQFIVYNAKSLIYPFIVILAFWGYGSLVAKLFMPGAPPNACGLKATLGLALTVAMGGWMNYFAIISHKSLHLLLLGGCMFAVAFLIRDWREVFRLLNDACCDFMKQKPLIVIAAANVMLLLSVLFINASFLGFNSHDDLQGYFAFPTKMLQLGALGDDPFSERRIVTSLGGKYFLDALVLADFGYDSLHLMDRSVGLLILLLLAFDACNIWKSNVWFRQFFIMAVLTVNPPTVNITSLLLGASVLLAILIYYHRFSSDFCPTWGTSVVLGLLLSVSAILKTSLVPVTALLGLAICILLWKNIYAVLCQLLIVSLAGVSCTAAWMVAMYQSCGTYWYPFLGRGFHGSAYGNFSQPFSSLNIRNVLNIGCDMFNLLGFVFVLVMIISVLRTRINPRSILVSLAIVLGYIITIVATGGYSVYRYTFAFVYPFVIYQIVNIAHASPAEYVFGLRLSKIGVLLLAILLGAGINQQTLAISTYLRNMASSSTGWDSRNRNLSSDRAKYRALQHGVPPGVTILERLEKPFLLDFRRNTIFINDYPGGSSLPSGMPYLRGSDALSQYLLDHSIQYIAYSYKSEANFSMAEYGKRLDKNMNAWIRSEAQHTFDYQNNIFELGRSRKIVFDDGDNYILDITSHNSE